MWLTLNKIKSHLIPRIAKCTNKKDIAQLMKLNGFEFIYSVPELELYRGWGVNISFNTGRAIFTYANPELNEIARQMKITTNAAAKSLKLGKAAYTAIKYDITVPDSMKEKLKAVGKRLTRFRTEKEWRAWSTTNNFDLRKLGWKDEVKAHLVSMRDKK